MILTLVIDGSAAPEEMLQHEDESGEEILSEDHDDNDDDDVGQEAVPQDPGDHGGSAGVQRVPGLLPGAPQLRLPRHPEH